jgi:hypothetical protein
MFVQGHFSLVKWWLPYSQCIIWSAMFQRWVLLHYVYIVLMLVGDVYTEKYYYNWCDCNNIVSIVNIHLKFVHNQLNGLVIKVTNRPEIIMTTWSVSRDTLQDVKYEKFLRQWAVPRRFQNDNWTVSEMCANVEFGLHRPQVVKRFEIGLQVFKNR